jgi:hypothetical protein
MSFYVCFDWCFLGLFKFISDYLPYFEKINTVDSHCNRNFDSSEFDSTGVKLYIFIHNEVRDFDKNSTQPEIRVNRIRDNESQLYLFFQNKANNQK